MKTMGKSVSWICIFSILLSGCYSYTTTVPTEAGSTEIDPVSVYAVLTKDGTHCEFDHAPVLENDKLAGIVGGTPVLISMSDVEVYYSREPDTLRTLGLLAGMGLVIAFYASFSNNWL